MHPTRAARAPREFSDEAIHELLRALRARGVDHPESPGLIASWPGVPADRMPAACAQLERLGYPVREISVVSSRDKVSRGWVLGETNGDRAASAAPARLGDTPTVLVLEVAEPRAVPKAREAVTKAAEREGAPEAVRSAIALAVTEACANVVLYAYVDAAVPGNLEVRAGRAGADLIVEVVDDGPGMVPRLGGSGLGLGLPLIAQMADTVEIRTEQGRGLVLRMRFDLEAARDTKR
jgi:anti-sigma regulatory factor (Ser/Thr protein kinase)